VLLAEHQIENEAEDSRLKPVQKQFHRTFN
jgi:hypothetical protein